MPKKKTTLPLADARLLEMDWTGLLLDLNHAMGLLFCISITPCASLAYTFYQWEG